MPRPTPERGPNAIARRKSIKRRLARADGGVAAVRAHIERAVHALQRRDRRSAQLRRARRAALAQAYRLAYWRVAAEEINYRRFFDINDLAAIRMEDPAVFERDACVRLRAAARGCIDGFRIDHVDGLYDPGDTCERLQARAREVRPDLFSDDRRLYLVVEKILGLGRVAAVWPVDGTTGYDFLVRVNGLFVDGTQRARDRRGVYERFTRLRAPFREFAYRGKQLILRVSMASELQRARARPEPLLGTQPPLPRLHAEQPVQAMREIIACFPVYRTYVNEREPTSSAHDRGYIERAVSEAKRRNPDTPGVVFDFIRDLLLKKADYIPEDERDEHMQFVGKFQQVTSPVTAKGIEDTALYIYNRLVSLNEVGGEPDHFGITPDALHALAGGARAQRWPHGLSATSTHDTKRSEDVRARINVLSEMPRRWKQATGRWARLNRRGARHRSTASRTRAATRSTCSTRR